MEKVFESEPAMMMWALASASEATLKGAPS
jgi:hypothetical protein